MPACNNCGGWVSEDFHRVFSNGAGELWGCLGCGANAAGERRAFRDRENTSTSYG